MFNEKEVIITQNVDIKKISIIVCIGAVVVNLILFFIKLYIGLTSGSLCILTDSVNNLLDCFSCIIASIGFYVITLKKNMKYPFGLGRAEDIVSFIMSVIVVITGGVFAYSSVERLFYPTPVWFSVKYAVILGLTVLVKLAMAFVYRGVFNKGKSPVMRNLMLDSVLDCFVSLTVIISFTLSEYIGYSVDGIAGLIISVMIIISGIKLLIDAVGRLVGKRDNKKCEVAVDIIMSCDGVTKVNSLECHSYGGSDYFQAVIETEYQSLDEAINLNIRIKELIKEKMSAQIENSFERCKLNEN